MSVAGRASRGAGKRDAEALILLQQAHLCKTLFDIFERVARDPRQ